MEMADARNHFFSQFAIFERSEQPAGEGRRRLRPHLFLFPFYFPRRTLRESAPRAPSGGLLAALEMEAQGQSGIGAGYCMRNPATKDGTVAS